MEFQCYGSGHLVNVGWRLQLIFENWKRPPKQTAHLYSNTYHTLQYNTCIHFPIHRIHNIETNIPKHFRKRSQKTKTKNKICISEETYKLYLYFCYKAQRERERKRNVSTKNGEAKIKCHTKRKNNININNSSSSSSGSEEFNWVHTHTHNHTIGTSFVCKWKYKVWAFCLYLTCIDQRVESGQQLFESTTV